MGRRLILTTGGKVVRFLTVLLLATSALRADPFILPTSNSTLFEPGGEEGYFVGTVDKPWSSGTFGCVRSNGWQLHEGIDIACVDRDSKGEPIDPVFATADGVVAYVNDHAGLSNYGRYVILAHEIDGLNVLSLYAHLSEIGDETVKGARVTQGQPIAIMGRTSNTRQRISRERAHLHFEINLMINEHFEEWFSKYMIGARNDHGKWNGLNLVGVDPTALFVAQRERGDSFRFVDFVRNQREFCRVRVPLADFSWLRNYPTLIRRNDAALQEGIVAYELILSFNGMPIQAVPRGRSEIEGVNQIKLLSVENELYSDNRCCKLVEKTGSWKLTSRGMRWIEKLTYKP